MDYSVKKVSKTRLYRIGIILPISLLPIFKKILKSIMVQKPTFWADKYLFFPYYYFERLKYKTTIDTFWFFKKKFTKRRKKKVLSLIIFNFKDNFISIAINIFI